MLTNFGKELRNYRKYHGLLLGDMAKALDMSPAELSSIETGRKPVPVDFLEKFDAVYHLPWSLKQIWKMTISGQTLPKHWKLS